MMLYNANLIFAVLLPCLISAENEQAGEKEWWRTASIYQIYPLSFRDGNNDGRGDLKGITEKIPYLKGTGIDAVWISPIYNSPMVDFGYDISNYTEIHEWYGTMEDFEEMTKTIHDSGMKLLLDFVPNHTSNEHEWFVKSETMVPGFEDFYVWKDPRGFDTEGNPIPPNNWTSVFYGPAWTYSKKRQQFYLHHFLREQPDLNYRNSKVAEEMNKVILFWLGKGVDGFRIDAVPFLVEHDDFLDEPKSLAGNDPMDHNYLNHIYTQNQPETYDVIQKWRELVDGESAKDGRVRVLMAEAYADIPRTMKYFGEKDKLRAHFPFNFQLLGLNESSDAQFVKMQVDTWLDNLPRLFKHSNWVVGNHDQRRVGSKVGPDLIDGINMLVTLLPGTSITYYGEEIGMVDNEEITYEDGVDPQGRRYPKDRFRSTSRDFERTPFQWDDSVNAGFNEGKKPWLPLHKNYTEVNLKAQINEPYSHYTIFKDLMALRKTKVIRKGALLLQNFGSGTLGLIRLLGSHDFVVVLINFTTVKEEINLDKIFLTGKKQLLVYTTHIESGLKKGSFVDSTNIKLPGRSGVVLTVPTKQK